MQVKENTATRLVLQSRPIVATATILLGFLALLAVSLWQVFAGDYQNGLGLIALALFMGAVASVFVEQTILFLDRGSDTVLFRRKSLYSAREETARLSDLRSARVEISQSNMAERKSKTTRPVLELAGDRQLPLSSHFSSGKGAERVVDTINGWLGVSQPHPTGRG
jgi:hypothetical protein